MNRLDCAFAHLKNHDLINWSGCSYKYLSKTRVNLTISINGIGSMVYENISVVKATKICKSAINC